MTTEYYPQLQRQSPAGHPTTPSGPALSNITESPALYPNSRIYIVMASDNDLVTLGAGEQIVQEDD